MSRIHLLSQSLSEWRKLFLDLGEPDYRSTQVRHWIFKNYKSKFVEMTNLPGHFVDGLNGKFILSSLETLKVQKSDDGTLKWLLKTVDEHLIECVMIPEEKRTSICLSSQVGCALGCKFCGTAKMGFFRNLSTGEIVEQFLTVSRYLNATGKSGVTNVIFMGMGEPLLNLKAVSDACGILTSKHGFNLSRKKITVSTSGVIPQIIQWAQTSPDIKLAISLNAGNNEMRSELMPINKKYPLKKLLETADRYVKLTGQRLTLEYILIKDRTCTPRAAEELKRIALERSSRVNLIALNGSDVEKYHTPSNSEIQRFMQILSHRNFTSFLRKPRGRDIDAACGQLVQQQKKVA